MERINRQKRLLIFVIVIFVIVICLSYGLAGFIRFHSYLVEPKTFKVSSIQIDKTNSDKLVKLMHFERYSIFALSENESTMAITSGHSLEIWDLDIGKRIAKFQDHTQQEDEYIYQLALSPNGTFLASISDLGNCRGCKGTLNLWNSQQHKLVYSKKDGATDILAFSPLNDKLAYTITDIQNRMIYTIVLDVLTGQTLVEIPNTRVFSFDQTGQRLAYADFQGIYIWDFTTGQRSLFQDPNSLVTGLLSSPDGTVLLRNQMKFVQWKP